MKLLVTRRMTERAEAALRARFDTTLLDRTQGLTPAEAARAMREEVLDAIALGEPRLMAELAAQISGDDPEPLLEEIGRALHLPPPDLASTADPGLLLAEAGAAWMERRAPDYTGT